MCPFTSFDFYIMFVYNCAFFGTVGMMFSHCEYFWVGLLVMLALALLIGLKLYAWELWWKIDELRVYKDALKSQDSERIEYARERYERNSWADMMFWALKMVGVAALVGLIVIPLCVAGDFKKFIFV